MSVLDLDYYKLTMLQFIWKHYADVPVTFRLHSRKQDLAEILVDVEALREGLNDYAGLPLSSRECRFLESLGVFETAFLRDLRQLTGQMPVPTVTESGVEITGKWFEVSLWETVVLSDVTEMYSRGTTRRPSLIRQLGDINAIHETGANWADFGTRRRHSYYAQARVVQALAEEGYNESGFIGTSNVHLARMFDVQPIGTYAHELEMVLRNYHDTEFSTTRDVLTKWQEMYPWQLRVALTDTYTTPRFLDLHGKFLLENDWRGVRLDSGDPAYIANEVVEWLGRRTQTRWDVVFSDGLDAQTIINLQTWFATSEVLPPSNINPVFGWGTGLTNPHSNLSLVMKAVQSNGQPTYKLTDDESKSIR